jgi:hypothetical protein
MNPDSTKCEITNHTNKNLLGKRNHTAKIDWRSAMPFAGTVTSTLLLLILLWAVGRPVKGLIVGNNVTATDAALMCYPNSVFAQEVGLVTNGAVSAPSPPMPPERRAPPPMPGDRFASATGSSPEDKLGLSWRAKAWCGWVLAVTLVITVFIVRS